MRLVIASDGEPRSTRVILLLEEQRIDLSPLVNGVTWHLDSRGGAAKALLQFDGPVAADVASQLPMWTPADLTEDQAMTAVWEVPG